MDKDVSESIEAWAGGRLGEGLSRLVFVVGVFLISLSPSQLEELDRYFSENEIREIHDVSRFERGRLTGTFWKSA